MTTDSVVVKRTFSERMLDGVERVGNKVPHPVVIFVLLILLVQAGAFAAFFAFLVLHARSQPTFIPIRDYDYFVDHSSTFVASAQQARSSTGQSANYR